MLELHIWGPAFGLPSIDPECIAAAAYLSAAAGSSSWRIVPSNDPSISPDSTSPRSLFSHLPSVPLPSQTPADPAPPPDHLPALQHNGAWTSGFRRIVNYLVRHGLAADLDQPSSSSSSDSSKSAVPDTLAYSAFLAEHAAPLLDLSLYVSAANWTAATRPAYSSLLPWPLTWTVPPLVRQSAVDRSRHLGLAELDTDFDPTRGLHLSTGRESLPESFRRHLPAVDNRTVREHMTPEQAAAIRLSSLAEGCFSVLVDLLNASSQSVQSFDSSESLDAKAGFLLGPTLSSLDCLALGYLSLMHDAPVPRAFLRDSMDRSAPQLTAYLARVRSATRLDSSPLSVTLAPPANTVLAVSARALDTAIRNAPGVGERYADEVRYRAEKGIAGALHPRSLFMAAGLVAAGAVLAYGVVSYRALPPFGARSQTWSRVHGGRLGQFGDLGSMLSSALGPVPGAPQASSLSTGRIVDTDSELD